MARSPLTISIKNAPLDRVRRHAHRSGGASAQAKFSPIESDAFRLSEREGDHGAVSVSSTLDWSRRLEPRSRATPWSRWSRISCRVTFGSGATPALPY
jgi:hypothetical protein